MGKKIIGFWDIDISHITLGGLITIIIELEILQKKYLTKLVELCIIWEEFRDNENLNINTHYYDNLEKSQEKIKGLNIKIGNYSLDNTV